MTIFASFTTEFSGNLKQGLYFRCKVWAFATQIILIHCSVGQDTPSAVPGLWLKN